MPRRPREHQLEAESRAAFRTAVPSRWAHRDLTEDYGIDAEVEIFGEDDLATGEKFLVQLKATDQPDLRQALKLWLPLAKLKYYRSLQQPVLLVRYHAPTAQLYARWFHSWSPYREKRGRSGVTLRLHEEDLWDEATPISIELEVSAFREIRSPRLSGPISFFLECDGDFQGVPGYEVKLMLRESCHNLRHIINFDGACTSPHRILLSNELIEVIVAGSPECGLPSAQQPSAEPRGPRHHDIIVVIGLAISRTGHEVEAAQIMGPFLLHSQLIAQPGVAVMAAQCLANANQMHIALEVAALLFEDDRPTDSGHVFLVPLLARRLEMSPAVQDLGVRVLGKCSEEAHATGDSSGAAVLEYNRGNLLRSMSRFREALRAYRRAAQLDPIYEQREYYWQELGGILFLGQRFRAAVGAYDRALAIDESRFTKLLHADALMFAGEYSRAEEVFTQLLVAPIDVDDFEWELKRMTLSWIRQEVGTDSQSRGRPGYPESFPNGLQSSEIIASCREALKEDALDGLAWFNLGACFQKSEKQHEAAMSFLTAALACPADLEAWGNVIAYSFNEQDFFLLCLAACTAYRFNGQDFLREVARRVPNNQGDFLDAISQLVQVTNREAVMTLRQHESTGTWTEIRNPAGNRR